VHFWCSLRFLGKLENAEANSFFPSSRGCSIHVWSKCPLPTPLKAASISHPISQFAPTSLSLLSHLPSFSIAAGGILAPGMVPCSLLWPQPAPSHHASASSSSPVSPPLWCSATPLLARPGNPSPALGLVAGCSDDGAPPTALPRGSCREVVRLRVRGLRLAGRWQP
jgi:hypothetical protein